jgi:hypothetical protein
MPDPAAIAALRRALLASSIALDAIAILPRPEALTALCDVASGAGFAIDAHSLRQCLRPGPLDQTLLELPPVTRDEPPSHHWLPAGLVRDGEEVLVEWAHFGTLPLSDPFFEDPLRRAQGHPVSRLLRWRTPLLRLAAADPCLDGMVFHMSRCGSTLVAQALAAMPRHLVLSEPAPFDDLLQFCTVRENIAFATRVALLRGMARALAQARAGPVRRRFLKTDCWHAGALPLLRAAFPDCPWVFLYRDGRDVLTSHARIPGRQALPGTHAALVGVDDPAARPGLDFAARVIAATCHRAADHAATGGGIFVDYAELPRAFSNRILPHFGIAPDASETETIMAALVRDAKEPRRAFDSQKQPAHRAASAVVSAARARHLAEAVERLRALNPFAPD